MQFTFASFRNESWRRRTKNYVYNENSKQIPKSVLTTFETFFMQNAKQIIVEKVTKTASKHQFEAVFVFCCRKRYSPESLAAQWIQGFAQLVFLFFCAFFKPFPNPHIDILTKPYANRGEKRAVRQHSPLSYFSLMICSYSIAYFFPITMLLW